MHHVCDKQAITAQ